jgi:hypothetical protein
MENKTVVSGDNRTASREDKYYGNGELKQMQQSEEDTMELSTEILIILFLLMLSIMGGHFLKKRRFRYL